MMNILHILFKKLKAQLYNLSSKDLLLELDDFLLAEISLAQTVHLFCWLKYRWLQKTIFLLVEISLARKMHFFCCLKSRWLNKGTFSIGCNFVGAKKTLFLLAEISLARKFHFFVGLLFVGTSLFVFTFATFSVCLLAFHFCWPGYCRL